MPTIIGGGGAGDTGGVATVRELFRNSNAKTFSLASGSYTVPAGKVYFLTWARAYGDNGAAKAILAVLSGVTHQIAASDGDGGAGEMIVGCNTPVLPHSTLLPVTSQNTTMPNNYVPTTGPRGAEDLYASGATIEYRRIDGDYIGAYDAGTVISVEALGDGHIQGYEVDATIVSGNGSAGASIYQELIIASGNWTVPNGVTEIEVDVIAAGGGGGGSGDTQSQGTSFGGGGSAGQILYAWRMVVSPAQVIAAVIGAAGVGGTGDSSSGIGGTAGGFTSFGNLKALGGPGGHSNGNSAYGGFGADPTTGNQETGIFRGAKGGANGGGGTPPENGYVAAAGAAGGYVNGGGGGFGLGPNGGQGGSGGLQTNTLPAMNGLAAPANSGAGGGGGALFSGSGVGGDGGNGGSGLIRIRYNK